MMAAPYRRNEGFTLIESALSILILSIVLISGIVAYKTWAEARNYTVTQERLHILKEALNIYIRQNRILPCPAPLDAGIDTAEFGVGAPCGPGDPAVPGTFDVAGASGGSVRIGTVPVRTIGLPDEFMADRWGRRFIYAATRELTPDPLEFRGNGGAISFVDTSGNTLVTPADSLMYVLVSTGPDGAGGYSLSGQNPAMACQDAATADGENCDNDAAFRFTSLYARSDLNTHFDDLIEYEIKEFIGLSSIVRYITRDYECADNWAGVTANPYGENCATAFFSGDDVYIDSAETPQDGLSIFNQTFTSEADGRVIIRTIIPITVRNAVAGTTKWKEALHAAVYVDGVLQAQTVLYDPNEKILEGHGYSSLIIAQSPIVKGDDYTVEIFIFTYGNDGVANVSGWVGSINHTNHAGIARVEIIEVEDI